MYILISGIPTSNISAVGAVMITLWISYDTVNVFILCLLKRILIMLHDLVRTTLYFASVLYHILESIDVV
jgi:hypothetical protein